MLYSTIQPLPRKQPPPNLALPIKEELIAYDTNLKSPHTISYARHVTHSSILAYDKRQGFVIHTVLKKQKQKDPNMLQRNNLYLHIMHKMQLFSIWKSQPGISRLKLKR